MDEEKCQFLIGNVKRNKMARKTTQETKVATCQFLIGNVKHVELWKVIDPMKGVCQFLIGNVKQLILSAFLHIILSNFPYFNPFFPKKSVDLFF